MHTGSSLSQSMRGPCTNSPSSHENDLLLKKYGSLLCHSYEYVSPAYSAFIAFVFQYDWSISMS